MQKLISPISTFITRKLFYIPSNPSVSIVKDITLYMCALHWISHATGAIYDPIMHIFIQMYLMYVVYTEQWRFSVPAWYSTPFVTKAITGTIIAIYALGTYWLAQQFFGYDPDGFWNFMRVPYSVSTTIFPSVFSCTIVHAKQFGRRIGAIPLLFALALTVNFTYDEDPGSIYTLLTEYWLYSVFSYSFLY